VLSLCCAAKGKKRENIGSADTYFTMYKEAPPAEIEAVFLEQCEAVGASCAAAVTR
jgi:hypothetical protein